MFNKILFSSKKTELENAALANTLLLACRVGAGVTLQGYLPDLPARLSSYSAALESVVRAALERLLESALQTSGLQMDEVSVHIEIAQCEHPFLLAVREVLREKYDLVVRALIKSEANGYLDTDSMSLLRKCPVPVMLLRPDNPMLTESCIGVAVNVDAVDDENPIANELTEDLLIRAADLCELFQKPLHVIACFDTTAFQMVNSVSIGRIRNAELLGVERQLMSDHQYALKRLLSGARYQSSVTTLLNGIPKKEIPRHIHKGNIDLLIIGTVGRSGLSGVLIGNTAEHIVQDAGCSVLAIKPKGFKSPIKLS